MSSLLSDSDTTWTIQKSMRSVHSRLQTVLASSLGIKAPHLLAVVQVCNIALCK